MTQMFAITCMNPPMNWFASHLVSVFGFVLVLLLYFVSLGFVLLPLPVCLVYDDDGLLDYVQVLHQFSFVALNSRWP